MEFPSDEEIEEAIENITLDIISYKILNDIRKEEEWQLEIANLLHNYFDENGIVCSFNVVSFSFQKWIETGSNLFILLSSVYPLEERVKFREHFAVRDLACILNGINPHIPLETKRWIYAKQAFIDDIFLIKDAIFSEKLKPISMDGQSAAFYDDFLSDARLLPAVSVIEWIDNEKKRDINFPLGIPEFITAYRRTIPEYSNYRDDNTDYMEFIHYLRVKFIDDIKKGTTAERLLDLIKQEKSDTKPNKKCTFYVFEYGKDKEIKVTDNLLKSFITIIRGSELSFRK